MTNFKCLDCGYQLSAFEDEKMIVEHKGESLYVPDLNGWRCEKCDYVEFDEESALRYAAASDYLIFKSEQRNDEG
jgi:HTH-type transcriptional regulator/antitoxin MqsA